MKKVFMIVLGLLTMMTASLSAKAQEITFLLRPGWNWIGYPYPESASIEITFGDFEPVSGDIIESEFGYSEYFEEYGWFGGIQNLEPGKGYIYYSNRTVPVTIVFGTPSSQSQVTVTTSEPMLITAISAMCGGEVTSNDGTYIITKGLCWATHENPTTNDDFYQEAESGVGSFSISMTELNIATTYYVRAYAVTPNGTVYGDQKNFTTMDGIPIVTTAEITDIFGDGATCGGTVTDNGSGLSVIAIGVCWSTSPNPNISDAHTTHTIYGSGLGSFTDYIRGLNLSTTYYVRAYASTIAGTGYGEEVCFTSPEQIWTNGVLPGVFSVSENRQVHFSQGNLQYQASTNTWRFAVNQWCLVGHTYLYEEEEEHWGNVYVNGMPCDNSSISSNYSGWIDLFGWGTSGWHDSSDSYNLNYHPWSWVRSTVNTSYNYYGYGPSINMPSPDLTDSSSNYDWGVNCSISNGGNQPSQWSTLTREEWNYVFNTRTTISGIRYVKARVGGVCGVILLPDDWDASYYTLTHINGSGSYAYSDNTISVNQWLTLEQLGAVFLPAAGYRNGTSIGGYFEEFEGHYWSASNKGSQSAYGLYFSNATLTTTYRSRFRGLSVRLICPAE